MSKDCEEFMLYSKEYMDLETKFPNTAIKEIAHRKKILKEWIDNELDKWQHENRTKKITDSTS